eukprot:1625764-Pyramimonas_sp.AAC.1
MSRRRGAGCHKVRWPGRIALRLSASPPGQGSWVEHQLPIPVRRPPRLSSPARRRPPRQFPQAPMIERRVCGDASGDASHAQRMAR